MKIILDTETTGLNKPEGNDLSVQPHMIEIYAMQVKDDGTLVRELDTLIKPPIPIPLELTKHVHGISDFDVKDAPAFVDIYKQLINVFFGSHTAVAHNLSFDLKIIINELKRIGKEYAFPYPPINFCTVEQSMHLKGYRLKNSELYMLATGKEMENAHRAKPDVLALYESYKFLTPKRR